MNNITCPCCNNSIAQISSVLLDNIKQPLGKECCFCLNELNPLNNNARLVVVIVVICFILHVGIIIIIIV